MYVVCLQLLAADIRHERNVILQCIRFVAQHFELHQKHHDNLQQQQQLTPANTVVSEDSRLMTAFQPAIYEVCTDDCVESKDQNMNIMHHVTDQYNGADDMYNSKTCESKVSLNDTDLITGSVKHSTADTVTHRVSNTADMALYSVCKKSCQVEMLTVTDTNDTARPLCTNDAVAMSLSDNVTDHCSNQVLVIQSPV